MKKRHIAVCVILSIITCGIYGLYWMYCVTDDIKKTSVEKSISGGMAVLLTIVTFSIYGFFWAYKMGDLLEKAKYEQSRSVDSSDLPILYLILQLLFLMIVNLALMQNELNKLNR